MITETTHPDEIFIRSQAIPVVSAIGSPQNQTILMQKAPRHSDSSTESRHALKKCIIRPIFLLFEDRAPACPNAISHPDVPTPVAHPQLSGGRNINMFPAVHLQVGTAVAGLRTQYVPYRNEQQYPAE
jgi:hypothetical protein